MEGERTKGMEGKRTEDKQQFNVYLAPALIRRAKHAAVDQAVSLSRLVEDALLAHLDHLEEDRRDEGATNTFRPRRGQAVRFYEALGLRQSSFAFGALDRAPGERR